MGHRKVRKKITTQKTNQQKLVFFPFQKVLQEIKQIISETEDLTIKI